MLDDANAGREAGNAAPVDHPAWLGEAERGLIDQAFEAFASRAKPEAIVWHLGRQGRRRRRRIWWLASRSGKLGDELFHATFPPTRASLA